LRLKLLLAHVSSTNDEGVEIKKLITCHDCDLLQYEVALSANSAARCVRCNASLYHCTTAGMDRIIFLVAGSAAMFIIANLFPIVVLEAQGNFSATTLFDTASALYEQGRPLIALLVFATTILLPALELSAMLYMLVPLRVGQIAPGLATGVRFVRAVHLWSMIEVFMLGVLVVLVKLRDIAIVMPGIALWALAGAIVLFSMFSTSFSIRAFWTWVDSAKFGGTPDDAVRRAASS
jgi:paraquat-inducible protein A